MSTFLHLLCGICHSIGQISLVSTKLSDFNGSDRLGKGLANVFCGTFKAPNKYVGRWADVPVDILDIEIEPGTRKVPVWERLCAVLHKR